MNIDREGKIDLAVVKSVVVKNDIQLENGDILFNNTNGAELIGKTALISSREHGFAFSNHMTKICLEDHLSKSFLAKQIHFLWMSGYFKYRCTHHVNQASISSKILADTVPLLLPPIREQTRVVEKLEELFSDLDAGVAELKAAQKKLAQYRQSLLKAAVEGALTTKWRAKHPLSPGGRGVRGEGNKVREETGAQLLERILIERRRRWEEKQLAKFKEQGKTPPKDWRDKYPEPVKPKTADLPELPEGWVWASVDQCAIDEYAITDGPFGSNLKSSHYTESGPRVIRLQNIGDGVFVDARAHISDEHYHLLKKHAIVENDVVVSMLGEILPRACIVPSNIAPAIVKADCARVRLNHGLLLPELLNACLNSQPTRERVGGLIKGIGRPRINLSHLRAICVPIPSLEEQHEIVQIISVGLEAITQQIDTIGLGLRQSSAQRQNILKAAFSGQLVPQDPNDEPASILLERIRAERAARANESKQRSGRRKAKGA